MFFRYTYRRSLRYKSALYMQKLRYNCVVIQSFFVIIPTLVRDHYFSKCKSSLYTVRVRKNQFVFYRFSIFLYINTIFIYHALIKVEFCSNKKRSNQQPIFYYIYFIIRNCRLTVYKTFDNRYPSNGLLDDHKDSIIKAIKSKRGWIIYI